jgi:transcriptional regulator with XRE-family HTH domain
MSTATAPLGTPLEERGLGSRTSGAMDNRPHYLPVGGERTRLGAPTESRLRRMRLKAGLTQERLAELTAEIDTVGALSPKEKGKIVYGISAYSINRFENGVHSPRPRYLKLIAEALSRALGERVTADDLRVRGTAGLATFLEKTREQQGVTRPLFYRSLAIDDAGRVDDLLEGRVDWTADELGRAAILFPEARPLTQDVLVEQARRNDDRLASAHPEIPGESAAV